MSGLDALVVRLDPDEPSRHWPPGPDVLRLMSPTLGEVVPFGARLIVDSRILPNPGDLVAVLLRSGHAMLVRAVQLTHKTLAACSPLGGPVFHFSLGSVSARTIVKVLAPKPGWSAVTQGSAP